MMLESLGVINDNRQTTFECPNRVEVRLNDADNLIAAYAFAGLVYDARNGTAGGHVSQLLKNKFW